jgi:hypothetical protein
MSITKIAPHASTRKSELFALAIRGAKKSKRKRGPTRKQFLRQLSAWLWTQNQFPVKDRVRCVIDSYTHKAAS